MSALVAAELLRLRTLRGPRYGVLGALVLVALMAANAAATSPAGHVAASLRAVAVTVVLGAAVWAANSVGEEFRLGAAAMTYLAHPRRPRVMAARLLTYGALGVLVGGLTAGVAVAAAAPIATSLTAADVLRLIGGTAFAAGVLGAAGTLVGTVARRPAMATSAIVAWSLAETLLASAHAGAYLPFALAGSVIGMRSGVATPSRSPCCSSTSAPSRRPSGPTRCRAT